MIVDGGLSTAQQDALFYSKFAKRYKKKYPFKLVISSKEFDNCMIICTYH